MKGLMAFCTKCGAQNAADDAFCAKCGAPRSTAKTPATQTATSADPRVRVADVTLKHQHRKVVAQLAIAGTLLAILINFILLMIADKIGGLGGGTFLIIVGAAASAAFVALLVPRIANRFDSSTEKAVPIDPITGRPLRMVWWFRWLTAMIAFWTFVGSSDYLSPPRDSTQGAAAVTASLGPSEYPIATGDPSIVSDQHDLDARLAVCVAVNDEYADALAARKVKDTIILANQYSVGQKAGGQAIGRAIGDYFDGKWTDTDCIELSKAPWTVDQGYAGDPISLPAGAIRITMCREANYCS